jgi:hypothetical protein
LKVIYIDILGKEEGAIYSWPPHPRPLPPGEREIKELFFRQSE